MKRTMFQLYLTDCDAAIEFYVSAFGAVVKAIHRAPENNTVMHAEIIAFGQCIAFSERDTASVPGNTMQFCFHFGAGGEEAVKTAYAVLGDGAQIDWPLSPCSWSPAMFSLIDKFGVNWCIFV